MERVADARTNALNEANGICYYEDICYAAKYLIGQVSSSGYTRASDAFFPYTPHWFRDSSYIAIALDDFASFSKRINPSLSEEAANAANRINTFNLEAIEHYESSMRRALRLTYEDQEFYRLSSHIPARVNERFGLFSASDGRFKLEDTADSRWLVQYDTLPLVLLAVFNEMHTVGISEYEKSKISKHALLWTEYLGKVYQTPSSEAWETDETDYIYFYNVAAIFKAKEILKQFAGSGMVSATAEEIERAFNFLYKNGGIAGALRDFVKDGIAYARRLPFNGPDTSFGIDAEQIFAFTRFGIGDNELGAGVEEKTMAKISQDLIGGNMLPIRNASDVYFCGGRWLLLGLEYANYELSKGNIESAKRRIDYILSKYRNSMPEQELVNPAHPESARGKEFLAQNGNEPIQRLNWSFASFTDSALFLNYALQKDVLRS
ncbi:MAG: hypothetical protein QXT43_03035 [Candidatus Micrarchaeaceae archaeon]